MNRLGRFLEGYYNNPNCDILPSEYGIDYDNEVEASVEQIEKDLEKDELYLCLKKHM